MSNGDIVVPPTDLNSAAIEAINLILSQLGISPLDILLGLFSGKPQFEDTNNVIWAYNMSAYWPLHALASDLQIAEKNGAPISDSRPAIQAQFGVWKQGTVTSIQTFAGVQAGSTGPGYWTIFDLIEKSWKASGSSREAVLQYVRALDALTQVLSEQKPPPPPPPPQPVPPPRPTPPPSPSGGDNDELGDYGDQILALLETISGELGGMQAPDTAACCNQIVAAIAVLGTALSAIASEVSNSGSAADLGSAIASIASAIEWYQPILVKLADCVCALGEIPSTPAVDLTPIVDALNSTRDVLSMFEKCVCDALQQAGLTATDMQARFAELIQRDVQAGFIDATDAQILLS